MESRSSFIEFFRKSPMAREVLVSAGETVLRQGEPGHSVFVVLSGKLGVFREKTDHREVIAVRGPGQLVGEMALFGQRRRSASVSAMERSLLLGLQDEDMLRLMLREPALGLSMSRLLASRLQELMDLELEEKNRELEMNRLALEADCQELRAVVEHCAQAILWLDPQGKPRYRNARATELFGASKAVPRGLQSLLREGGNSLKLKGRLFRVEIRPLPSGGQAIYLTPEPESDFSASMNKV